MNLLSPEKASCRKLVEHGGMRIMRGEARSGQEGSNRFETKQSPESDGCLMGVCVQQRVNERHGMVRVSEGETRTK